MTIRSMPRRRYFTPIPGGRAAYCNTTPLQAAPSWGALTATQKDRNIGVSPPYSTPARRTGPTISNASSPLWSTWLRAGYLARGGRASCCSTARHGAGAAARGDRACRPLSRASAPAASRSRRSPSTRRWLSLSTTSHGPSSQRRGVPHLQCGAWCRDAAQNTPPSARRESAHGGRPCRGPNKLRPPDAIMAKLR